jgi:hypothetical protein
VGVSRRRRSRHRHELTLELVAPEALWAGYQLWDITALKPVTEAWSSATGEVGDALSTSISVLHTPPGSPFPASLQGVPIVHLASADKLVAELTDKGHQVAAFRADVSDPAQPHDLVGPSGGGVRRP